jgi:CRISPR/Cas system-associated exonuclease Cas4 (RecB family)
MMDVTIEYGAIFYGKIRNRLSVEFYESLREEAFILCSGISQVS